MKISKTAWLILGIGFFVLASAVLVVLFFNQSGDAEKLEENLAANQILLTKLSSDSEVLNNQLIQLDNQLDEAEVAYNQSKANYPQVVISIEYDEELFLIADDCDLEVMSLIASEPRENEVEEVTFDNTVFDLEVRGTVSNILSFIDYMVYNVYFNSATVELVRMEVPEPQEGKQPVASIKIIVYSYEGE